MIDRDQGRCWVVRTDRTVLAELVAPDLARGILRQGWGWDRVQDLRHIREKLSRGGWLDGTQLDAWSHNRRLLPGEDDAIEAGDLMVLPNTPGVGQWSIAEAGSDYDFEIAHTGDHGHQRSIRLLRDGLDPGGLDLPAGLRRTMRCQRAVWNIDHHRPVITALVDRAVPQQPTPGERLRGVILSAQEAAWRSLQERFGGAEFEAPVGEVLKTVFDEVEHRGGPSENGADFICRFVGPLNIEFTVAVQVKMWEGVAEDQTPLRQLATAARERPLSAAVAMTTAERTSGEFDKAVATLSNELRMPVRVVCRDELMHMILSIHSSRARGAHGGM